MSANLGSEPPWRADSIRRCVSFVFEQSSRVAKVSNSNFAFKVDQYIIGLEVSVDDRPLVKIVQSKQDLVQNVLCDFFSILSVHGLHKISEHTLHERQKYKEFVSCSEGLLDANKLWAVRHIHLDTDFVAEPVSVWLLSNLHNLHRIFLFSLVVLHFVDYSVGSLTDFVTLGIEIFEGITITNVCYGLFWKDGIPLLIRHSCRLNWLN